MTYNDIKFMLQFLNLEYILCNEPAIGPFLSKNTGSSGYFLGVQINTDYMAPLARKWKQDAAFTASYPKTEVTASAAVTIIEMSFFINCLPF